MRKLFKAPMMPVTLNIHTSWGSNAEDVGKKKNTTKDEGVFTISSLDDLEEKKLMVNKDKQAGMHQENRECSIEFANLWTVFLV